MALDQRLVILIIIRFGAERIGERFALLCGRLCGLGWLRCRCIVAAVTLPYGGKGHADDDKHDDKGQNRTEAAASSSGRSGAAEPEAAVRSVRGWRRRHKTSRAAGTSKSAGTGSTKTTARARAATWSGTAKTAATGWTGSTKAATAPGTGRVSTADSCATGM